MFVQADISTPEGVKKINVGDSTTPPGGALAVTDENWVETINWNLLAAVRLDRGLLPMMLDRVKGVQAILRAHFNP